MPNRQLRIHNVDAEEGAFLTLTRDAISRTNQVYFHILNRPLRYELGRNRILYIGTTSQGLDRLLSSVGERAYQAFRIHGVDTIEVHSIACRPTQRVQTWRKLEIASIIAFREVYGEIPKLNSHGHGYVEDDEFEYFNRNEVKRFLRHWEP